MSAYIRKPIEFKKYPLFVKIINSDDKKRMMEAKSLISIVLMATNGLNPAQKEALKKAKELLDAK